ncbi:MAG: MFS transporter [Alcaligenaceae bacterium]|nr:MAG: MFS transporter [Alcaligenaceae bacterium]
MRDESAVPIVDAPNANDQHGRKSSAKAIRAALVGTIVEYYDFGIYGYMATTMASLFFAAADPAAALLGTFATFAVAFFLRIPGGIAFGHIGDRYGRKNALSATILLMVVATAGIGLLPSYLTLGIWATTLLVLARCLQGFAAGGEVSGANAYVAESAPRRWRATQVSVVSGGSYTGSLVASLVALTVTSVFDEQTVLDWAWRMPFLLSVVLGFVGIWVRSQLDDTPEFKAVEEEGDTEALPIRELLTSSGTKVVKIVFLGAQITGGYYITTVYAAAYLKTTGGHSAPLALLSTSIALILGFIALPLAGWAADTWGRRPVLFAGSASGLLLGFPMFMLMGGGSAWQAIVGQSVLFICVAVVNGASYAAYAEMFKTSVRYSGIALGNNISNTLLGGTAPFIATFLIGATGYALAPAAYFVFTATLTLGAVFFIKETKGVELADV